MAGEGEIKVYGAIRSMTGEGKVALASQIYDEAQDKFQDKINEETANEGLVSAKVEQTFTDAEKEKARNNIGAIGATEFYFSDINTSDITEGTLTDTVKTKLIALRNDADTNGAKLVMLKGGATDIVAVVQSYGSTFTMWFIEGNRLCEVTADADNTTWGAHWTTLYVKPATGIPDSDTAFAEAISEALASLNADVAGLREMLKTNLGEATAEGINLHSMLKMFGRDFLTVADGAPDRIPFFVGEQWQDKTTNEEWYTAVITGNMSDWHKKTDTSKQNTISDLDAIRTGASKGNTAYQKPSGGIPKTDLTSDAQTSLGKADTAYQKPAGGIPDTDTAFAEAASEAIISLYYDLAGLRKMLQNNLGETKAECIDFHYIPKVCGQPLVIKGAGAPAVVPAFDGQRYHDTTNRKIYEAIAVTGSTADWVLLN